MLPIVELIRLEEDEEFGTFGVLKINKQTFCVPLEPPDRENMPFRSSIPAQQYTCKRHESQKFGETFIVTKVPARDRVLFHAGNVVDDTEGCINWPNTMANSEGIGRCSIQATLFGLLWSEWKSMMPFT